MELSNIEQKIYTIREQRVMLDVDLAGLYEVETNYLKRQVRRNIERFPPDFCFELTPQENESLRSQIGTLKRGKHSKYLAFAFSEQGVAMLSGVVHSEKAIAMNIAIMRAFIALRKVTLLHYDLAGRLHELSNRLGEHDVQLAAIYDTIKTLLDKKQTEEQRRTDWEDRERIGFQSS